MKKTNLLLLFFLIGQSLLVSYPSFGQTEDYLIQGRVFDRFEHPVGNATVSLKSSPSNQTLSTMFTDTLGYYFFQTKDQPPFVIQAAAYGYATAGSRPFTPGRGKEHQVETIFLDKTADKPAAPKILPVANFVQNKMIEKHILPTQGAEELFYALNPELKDRDTVSANYVIREPEFPPFTKNEIASYNARFKADNQKDPAAHTLLRDSIESWKEAYLQLTNLQGSSTGKNEIESTRNVASVMNKALDDFSRKIKKTRIVKANQIRTLVSAGAQLIRKCNSRKSATIQDKNKLEFILADLSILLPSDAYKKLTGLRPDQAGHGGFLQEEFMDDEFLTLNELDQLFSPTEVEGNNKLRSFVFTIWKYDDDGNVLTSGPEVEHQYFVSYFPPALKDDPDLYSHCYDPATYARVSLPKARFGIEVHNLADQVVPTSDNLIYTLDAYRSASIVNVGGTNSYRIILRVDR